MLATQSRAFEPIGTFLSIKTRSKVLFQATWRVKREKKTIVHYVLTIRFEPIGWDDSGVKIIFDREQIAKRNFFHEVCYYYNFISVVKTFLRNNNFYYKKLKTKCKNYKMY
jgi:hypothetical protein